MLTHNVLTKNISIITLYILASSSRCAGGMVNLKGADCVECLPNIMFYGTLEYDQPFGNGISCIGGK